MIKAIIADSEEDAIGQMETLLADLWPELQVCGKAQSGPEALHLIECHKPQLAFMEVRLPGICGMQVARKVTGFCQVVFTTSYDHYAVNAFDGGALDYLLKPVGRDRLQKAVVRAKRQLFASPCAQRQPDSSSAEPNNRSTAVKQNYLQWICANSTHRSKLVAVDRVCYFKADLKYTSVITADGEILINKPIKCLADELDPTRFWRIHRSTIVNVSHIKEVSRSKTGRGTLRMKDREEILTVSRPYLHLFKHM
jgi:DNA-binding LytR/AlgR family response regulator